MNRREQFYWSAIVVCAVFIAFGNLGCQTSRGYRALVTSTYPVIADRMERYDLSDADALAVTHLRDVAKDEKTVNYPEARSAWESVAPAYRLNVASDALLSPPIKTEWMITADILDRGQRSEERYRQSLGMAGSGP